MIFTFEMLEPYAGKLARTVLRGASSSNVTGLPDVYVKIVAENRAKEEDDVPEAETA